jgi:hypothetical protein
VIAPQDVSGNEDEAKSVTSSLTSLSTEASDDSRDEDFQEEEDEESSHTSTTSPQKKALSEHADSKLEQTAVKQGETVSTELVAKWVATQTSLLKTMGYGMGGEGWKVRKKPDYGGIGELVEFRDTNTPGPPQRMQGGG